MLLDMIHSLPFSRDVWPLPAVVLGVLAVLWGACAVLVLRFHRKESRREDSDGKRDL